MKNKLLKMVAKTSKNVAIKSCDSASWFMCYQPVEPKELRELSKRKHDAKK